MTGPRFPSWVDASVHECAPDHSTQVVQVGLLREAAATITALYEALQELNGPHGWAAGRKADRAMALARGEKRKWWK